jgi:hypothetical protein
VGRLLDRGPGRITGRDGRRTGAGAILLVLVRREHARRTLFAPRFSSCCNECGQRLRDIARDVVPDDHQVSGPSAGNSNDTEPQEA